MTGQPASRRPPPAGLEVCCACPPPGARQRLRKGGTATTGSQDEQEPRGYTLPGPRQDAGEHAGAAIPDDPEVSDAELLQRHVEGDPEAFGILFQRHRERLWAVAVRTLGDPEEAADALQDAMIAAFRRAESFRGDSAVTTWLHRIVVNAALDRIRRRAARPTTGGQDEMALDALATSGQPLSDPSGVSDTAMDVREALAHLVPDQQAALVLVDMLGYSMADAGEVLDVSEGTVKSRAARGRARLLPRLRHLRPGSVPAQDSTGQDSTGQDASAAPAARVQAGSEGGGGPA